MPLAARLLLAALLVPVAVVAACGGGDSEAGAESGGWRALHPAPLERTEVGAARLGDQIYVVRLEQGALWRRRR
jgi:hypothetical protein